MSRKLGGPTVAKVPPQGRHMKPICARKQLNFIFFSFDVVENSIPPTQLFQRDVPVYFELYISSTENGVFP